MAAIVADSLAVSVKRQGNTAVGARQSVAAIGAQKKGGQAPSVQEQHGLLAPVDDPGQFFLQGPGQGRMARVDLVRIGHVHKDEIGVRGRGNTIRKESKVVLAFTGVVPGLKRRGG